MSRQQKSKASISKARALLRAGKPGEAAAILNKLLARTPKNSEALELMASLLFRQGDYNGAAGILQTLIAVQPDNVSLLNKMAVILAMQSQFPQAAAYLRQAIKLDPDCFPACLDLCKVTREMGLLDQSIEAGLQAVRLQADDPHAHSSLALSYERFGQHLQAHAHYRRAAELAPEDIHRQFACAMSYIGVGEKQRARELLQRVIGLQADHAQAHWMLSRLDRCSSPEDSRLKHLEALLDKSKAEDEDRVYLHFALGRMYEDCADYDKAFTHFSAGNRIENTRCHYKPDAYGEYVDALIQTWSSSFLSRFSEVGSNSRTPLFIVGLPRSGTSLVEQILAVHPEVYGAGELSWFSKTEHDLAAFIGSTDAYPACATALQQQHIEVLSKKYLAYLTTLSAAGEYRYITDKMPSNYERIGLIAALFPGARIIHCRRDPLDNAISQFSLLFQGSMEYSHDLYNLGRHYADYRRLMAHWETCLPENILAVDYESLVADHESEIRRLLGFLGLPWNADCLDFFNAKRAVRTLSDFQVRTPIYATSVGRWKHYERFLEPVHNGLHDGASREAKDNSAD
jgi:tetratricopeptide (TPR) repeat protein